jgi:histidine ammonia-lyase
MNKISFGARRFTIEDIWQIAQRTCAVELSSEPDVRKLLARSAGHMEDLLRAGRVIYGVTTGYGDSCETEISPDLMRELPLHLTRYHGCGTGRFFDEGETRAIMAARVTSLVHGWSGVSVALVELIVDMLRLDILPRIPAEGSVGASGDLTPLSYLAGALAGERTVQFGGTLSIAAAAFQKAGLKPIVLGPKEGLAVMNGTAVMTGLAALAYARAESLSKLASRLSAMASLALLGNPEHFDERLASAKPHEGQMRVAARIRKDLAHNESSTIRLQDRYSIRCAPHVIGVLEDAFPMLRTFIETEINSANDNPLFDPTSGKLLHGGHFYGGHIAFAMDSLKTLVANIADLLDRQFALLVDTRFNNGLPANLSGSTGPRAAINHGLKALQIASSAWTAEALKLCMPASVFSRSTECHNQDKVSMGTIAARDALRVLQLCDQVAAAHTIACVQALRHRIRDKQIPDASLGSRLRRFMGQLDGLVPFVTEDVALDSVLETLCAAIASRSLPLADVDAP